MHDDYDHITKDIRSFYQQDTRRTDSEIFRHHNTNYASLKFNAEPFVRRNVFRIQ